MTTKPLTAKQKAEKSANRPATDKRAAPRTAFKPGQSGNPNGRPKKTEQEFALEAACQEKAPEALDTIVDIMRHGQSDKVRLTAAAFVIERRYGKAVQRLEDVTDPLKKALANLPADKAQEMLDALEQMEAIRKKAASAA